MLQQVPGDDPFDDGTHPDWLVAPDRSADATTTSALADNPHQVADAAEVGWSWSAQANDDEQVDECEQERTLADD